MNISIRNCRLALATVIVLNAAPAMTQVRAVYDDGANAMLRQLQRLHTTSSVLHTGAHPDDEDSALVAYHARGEHARTAYLSLTRGSGGQNIIGPEQSDLLGVIRTEELLQARRLDGAEQLFTSAVDFGFSKHRAETARQWDEEIILGDMVRAIRRFRPNVIISRWAGSPADGHGHHQYSGYLTPLAFEAAADPDRFPSQVAEGLAPWQVQKLYVMPRRGDGQPTLLVDTGAPDPVTGRSYFEIGMRGRSQQKTQQMGSLELRGRQLSALRLVESSVDSGGEETSVFDGIDTSIRGIADFETAPNAALERLLANLERSAADALEIYRPLEPQALLPVLSSALSVAKRAHSAAQSPDAERLIDEKIREIETALVLAAGIEIDALADAEVVVPGDELGVAVRVFDPGWADVDVRDVRLSMPRDWYARTADAGLENEQRYRRRESPDEQFGYAVQVPNDAAATSPYWLRKPRSGWAYDWTGAGDSRTAPFDPPLLSAIVSLDIDGTTLNVRKGVEHRLVDRVRGELRRSVDVVPAVSVEPAESTVIVPLSGAGSSRTLQLTIRNNSAAEVSGRARLVVPTGWRIEPGSSEFTLAAKPGSSTLSFDVRAPDSVVAGSHRFEAMVSVDGQPYRQRMTTIEYPHIQTHRVYAPAVTTFEVIDVDVAPVRIGYVMGSGDKVPEALRRLGIDVELLDDASLTAGDLSRFDTIVVGIRASQTRPAFVANHQRLLEFAEKGGALIVQYQQPDFIDKGLAPYPATMQGNVRVVDETAPVVILEPTHPVFTFPNRIDSGDFEGWVQERNNYNFTSFDEDRYVPLLESHDDGEDPAYGGMLYARIGRGHYIYTSYGWFRQLPAGVPGAYRLFANLLSLPAAD
jgi:LmbE family N-acetylglucosaminyl deacetylase